MIRKKYPFAGFLLLAGCMILGISVFALWKVADTAHNLLTLGSYDVELKEEYTVPDDVYPGMSINKKVEVKNQGSVDAVIRIRFEKAFGTRTTDGSFHKDENLDSEVIHISCNEKYWKEKDGYWYYSEVLKAGEQTKEPLFESFYVSEKADNSYKGKDAEIIVYMESIQAEPDALTLWNTTREELKLYYELKEAKQDTEVIFQGEKKGFSFSTAESDLFANFKNLVPGCSRTQNIQIKNQSEKSVEISLYAEVTEQDKISQEEQELLDKILNKEAQIVVRNGKEILYKGPVSGNPSRKKNSMGERNKISLGKFSAGSEKNLIVELSLSPMLEHSNEKLTGRIDWIFCAEGEETSIVSSVPKTGDNTKIMMYICIGIAAFLIFCLLVVRRNKV